MAKITRTSLLAWRAEECLSQSMAASACGMSLSTYKRMEAGKLDPQVVYDRAKSRPLKASERSAAERRRCAKLPARIVPSVLLAWRALNNFRQTDAAGALDITERSYRRLENQETRIPVWVQDVVIGGADPIAAREGCPEKTQLVLVNHFQPLRALPARFAGLSVPDYRSVK